MWHIDTGSLFRMKKDISSCSWLSSQRRDFMADKAQRVADMTEKSLRKDLQSSSQLSYRILLPDSGGLPPQSLLTGLVSGTIKARGNSMIGSVIGDRELKPFCFVFFSLDHPRRFELQAFIHNPVGPLLVLYRLAYAVPLRKAVRGPVEVVENAKTGLFAKRSVSFIGESETSARLNGSTDLLTLAEKIAVTSIVDQSQTRSIDLFCQILPRSEGSLLAVHTLSRALAFRETLMAAEVLQLAAAIEARL
jgi:hypothetical protein